MPIEFKCEIDGKSMCETCEHESKKAYEAPCVDCIDSGKCPIATGYEHMSACNRCSWREKEERE